MAFFSVNSPFLKLAQLGFGPQRSPDWGSLIKRGTFFSISYGLTSVLTSNLEIFEQNPLVFTSLSSHHEIRYGASKWCSSVIGNIKMTLTTFQGHRVQTVKNGIFLHWQAHNSTWTWYLNAVQLHLSGFYLQFQGALAFFKVCWPFLVTC